MAGKLIKSLHKKRAESYTLFLTVTRGILVPVKKPLYAMLLRKGKFSNSFKDSFRSGILLQSNFSIFKKI